MCQFQSEENICFGIGVYNKGRFANIRKRSCIRDKHGGGLIEFVKNVFIFKRLKEYEIQQSESVCSDFTIANRKWICLNIYRPPNPNNMSIFFDEITASLSKAAMKYENIIIMGDFNVGIKK